MSDPYIGQIQIFGFNFAPRGWAQCNGQLLPISQNTALFSLLGTYYGGNGQTTFALPDLRGRTALHVGQGPGLAVYDQGQTGGVEAVTLSVAQLPAHAHTAHPAVSTGDQTTDRPDVGVAARGGVYGAAGGTGPAFPVDAAGGGQPHDNLPPYLVLNVCIALQGIFPSRN